MTGNDRRIDALRRQIPSFTCVTGCYDCGSPAIASPEKMACLPKTVEAEHAMTLTELSCPHPGRTIRLDARG